MKRMTRVLLWIAVAVSLVGAVLGFVFSRMEPDGRADVGNATQVVQGSRIYTDNCASCHGEKLEGESDWRTRKPDGRLPAPPHDETGHTWHHPDRHLFRVTKIGVAPPLVPDGYESDMPAFEGVLTDEEIWAVIAFIKSSWPEKFQDRQRRRNEAAEQ